MLTDDSSNTKATTSALIAAYTAIHSNVTINVDTRPGGTDGDNIVKTRLASGEMSDIFAYNSGSLLQALHPVDTLVDLSKEPFIENIDQTFIPTVSQSGQIFGVPYGTGLGGGMLYNKAADGSVLEERHSPTATTVVGLDDGLKDIVPPPSATSSRPN